MKKENILGLALSVLSLATIAIPSNDSALSNQVNKKVSEVQSFIRVLALDPDQASVSDRYKETYLKVYGEVQATFESVAMSSLKGTETENKVEQLLLAVDELNSRHNFID